MTAVHVSTLSSSSDGSQQLILRSFTPSFLLKNLPTAQIVMIAIAVLLTIISYKPAMVAAIFRTFHVPHLIPSIPHISLALSNGLSITAAIAGKIGAVLEAICKSFLGLGKDATKAFRQVFHEHWIAAKGALAQADLPLSVKVVYQSDLDDLVNGLEDQATLIANQRDRLDGHDKDIADLRAARERDMVDVRNYIDSKNSASS